MKNSLPEKTDQNRNDCDAGATPSNITPAFVRLPRAGQREPFSGLTRTQLFNFIKTGRVKSHSLKMPGTTRGVRLIDCASLRAAIQSFGDNQQRGDAL